MPSFMPIAAGIITLSIGSFFLFDGYTWAEPSFDLLLAACYLSQ